MGLFDEVSATPITDRLKPKSNVVTEVTSAKTLAVHLGNGKFEEAKDLTPRAIKEDTGFTKMLARAARNGSLTFKQIQDIIVGRKS